MTNSNEEYNESHDQNSRYAFDDAKRIVDQGDVTNAVERYLGMSNEEQAKDYSSRLHFFLQHHSNSDDQGDILYRIFESLLDDTLHRLEVKKNQQGSSLEDRREFQNATNEILSRHSKEIQSELRNIWNFEAMFGDGMRFDIEKNNIDVDSRTSFDKQGQFLGFTFEFKANIIPAN